MQNQLLSPHFTLLEFTESETARKHGIDNSASEEIVENLRQLCQHTLEPLREALGQPLIINSGYRCKELNQLIYRSAKNSQHMKGQAADFYVCWNSPLSGPGQSGDTLSPREQLVRAFRLLLTSEEMDYDQLILYPTFIHVSYVSAEKNRHAIMVARNNQRFMSVSRAAILPIL